MRPWDVLGPTVRLYHGSYIGNVSSLLERGIVSRKQLLDCDEYIDGVLADYGVTRSDLETWVWRYPLERCQETATGVYLSADYEYALGNSLAGFEAEDRLRQMVAKQLGLPGYLPPDRDSVVCAVDVPTKVLFSDEVASGTYGAEREAIFFDCLTAHRSDGRRTFEDEYDVLKLMFRVALFSKSISPKWIKTCWSAKRPEFYRPKRRA